MNPNTKCAIRRRSGFCGPVSHSLGALSQKTPPAGNSPKRSANHPFQRESNPLPLASHKQVGVYGTHARMSELRRDVGVWRGQLPGRMSLSHAGALLEVLVPCGGPLALAEGRCETCARGEEKLTEAAAIPLPQNSAERKQTDPWLVVRRVAPFLFPVYTHRK